VHPVDDRGRAMDAEYLVEADGGHLALIMESRSGSSGTRAPRNPDYNHALGVLLARLGMLNALLVDALVDSRHTQDLDLPEADRRLIQAPIRLALEPDPDALRRRLCTAQAKIAQAPDATKGGNSTKRIRLRVDVPGFQPRDAARLAQTLAAPIAETSEKRAGYWREPEAGENVFMEITRREDIGTDLKAPAAARGGVVTASYVLVPLVQPGDVVIHYDSRQEAIVGVSVASSAAEPAPIYWVARGSYARRAGEQPRWLPGIRIALDQYQQLEQPVTLWTAPGILEALIPGRMQSHACTAEVPQGRVVKAEAAVSSGSCSAGLVRPDPVRVESEGCRGCPAEHAFFHPAAQFCCQAPVVGQAEPVGDLAGVP
jgi:hypothetical protein